MAVAARLPSCPLSASRRGGQGVRTSRRGGQGVRVAYPRASAQAFDDAVPRSRSIFRSVGISYVQGTVRGPSGAEATVRFLIDSGATYSLLPESVWRAIGLAPKREMEFVLADGTTVHRAVSECHLSLAQGEGHAPVVLGQPGDAEPLLGDAQLASLGGSRE